SSFPLYIYPADKSVDQSRHINFDEKLYAKLKTLAKHPQHGEPDEVAVFDYIYGVLHCPAYRETYAEFLKIDFPRIPWPANSEEFWDVSTKGTALRKLHLMDAAAIGATPFPFLGEGDSVVDKIRFEDGKVWINAGQYFDDAPAISWGFYIGGYQPAQKWLKDRKGRALSFEDVKHYQRILKILSETNRIMQTISMTLDTEGRKP
ncbi:MAG TPA: DNA methyltransferase, partial [Pseudomonadales bacterium]|nr:DNA methyltransferase [Pseudomonadales bacterium]